MNTKGQTTPGKSKQDKQEGQTRTALSQQESHKSGQTRTENGKKERQERRMASKKDTLSPDQAMLRTTASGCGFFDSEASCNDGLPGPHVSLAKPCYE